jgi:hypothetical protein
MSSYQMVIPSNDSFILPASHRDQLHPNDVNSLKLLAIALIVFPSSASHPTAFPNAPCPPDPLQHPIDLSTVEQRH